jgi:hypothetical protein
MPLYEEVVKGGFVRANDEDIAREERLLIENLECTSNFVSDHSTNLFMELEGKLPDAKPGFLEIIDRFLALSDAEKRNFIVGRRVGIYSGIDDMEDTERHKKAEEFVDRIIRNNGEFKDEVIWQLMERFI